MALRLKLFLLVMLCSVSTAYAAGKLYKWVDKNGNVSYHDQPPSDGAYRVEEKNIGFKGETRAAADDVVQKFPVILYSAPKCASCEAARIYLRNRGVPFSEKNVEGDRQLQDELIKQGGGLSVPTIVVGTKVMRGYLESLLEGELDQAGYPKPKTEETEKTAAP
jgi:glutaredoxin